MTSVTLRPAARDRRRILASDTDAELVRRAAASDTFAFCELVRRHQGRVRALLGRLTHGDANLTDDLTQEAFLRAFRGIRAFEGRARFSTWLHRIAYHAYLNHRDRSPRHAALPDGFDQVVPAPEGTHSPGRADLRADMSAAVDELPAHYRTIVMMHFVRQLPYRDIATRLDMPLGTVKTQLFRAKAMLRHTIESWNAAPRARRNVDPALDIPPSTAVSPPGNPRGPAAAMRHAQVVLA